MFVTYESKKQGRKGWWNILSFPLRRHKLYSQSGCYSGSFAAGAVIRDRLRGIKIHVYQPESAPATTEGG